jgi:hypothetical protein
VSGQSASTLTLCRLNVWRTFVLVRRDTFTMLIWCLANLMVSPSFPTRHSLTESGPIITSGTW